MKKWLFLALFVLGVSPAYAQTWSGQCPTGTASTAIGCQPKAVSPQLTDLLLGWQIGQVPHTRTFQIQDINAVVGGPFLPLTGGTLSGGLTVNGATVLASALNVAGISTLAGTLNSTAATPYEINGSPVINLLANQSSPILSPEIQNIPLAAALYFPAPLVAGYATSATAGSAATYNSMITANLTAVGTAPNHWGLEEHTINLLGAGTISGELNVQKNYLLTASTVTLASGENFEAGLDNFGAISGIWHGYTSGMANASTGTITRVYVFDAGITNNNVTGNSIGIYVGYHCPTIASGSGSAPGTDYCIFNEDPKGEIVNMGHYSARNDTNVPTLSGGCGTGGGALSATSGDDAGQMTIGVGGTITTCSIVFHLNYGNLSTAIVVASDGGTPPSYTYNGGGINISALRSGGVYQYWAIGAN